MKTRKVFGQSLVETVLLNTLVISGVLAILSSCREWIESYIEFFLAFAAGPLP